jgi:hypothetical protein
MVPDFSALGTMQVQGEGRATMIGFFLTASSASDLRPDDNGAMEEP